MNAVAWSWLILPAGAAAYVGMALYATRDRPGDDPPPDRPEEQELRFDVDAHLARYVGEPDKDWHSIDFYLDQKRKRGGTR